MDGVEWIIFCMYATPILITAMVIVAIAWALWEFWLTPRDAKTLRKAARRKKPILDIERDDGYADYEIADKVFPNGVVRTESQKYFFFPSPLPTEGEAQIENRSLFDYVKSVFRHKSILRGCNVPIWHCWSGGTVACNAKSLAILEYSGNPNQKGKFKLPLAVNVDATKKLAGGRIDPFVNDVGEPETVNVEVLFPVDAKLAYDAVPHVWLQAQWRATELEIRDALEKKMRQQRENWKTLIVVVGFALGMGTLFLVAAHFLLGM